MLFHKPLITTLLFPTTVVLFLLQHLLPYYLTMFVVVGQPQDDFSFVGGPGGDPVTDTGNPNTAKGYSFVGAGNNNTAQGYASFVGAGDSNIALGYSFVGAGFNNTAIGWQSVISGGWNNIASGISSSILGGEANQASGFYSIAMGVQADANKDRSLVINLGKKLKQVSSNKEGQVLVNADSFTFQIGGKTATIDKKNFNKFFKKALPKKGKPEDGGARARRRLQQQHALDEKQQSTIHELQQQIEKQQEQINELYRMMTAAGQSTEN